MGFFCFCFSFTYMNRNLSVLLEHGCACVDTSRIQEESCDLSFLKKQNCFWNVFFFFLPLSTISLIVDKSEFSPD